MDYNVYYYVNNYYDAPTSQRGTLSSYAVFDARDENHAMQLADNWLYERHGDGHYDVWHIVPSHEFVDDDDYSTGF